MTRRDFLKGTAGLVLACGTGFGISLARKITSVPVEEAIGPKLSTDITLINLSEGSTAYMNGLMVFRTNSTGGRLLKLADGRNTIEEILEKAGCFGDAANKAVEFFITLGKAGYLENRVEVNTIENRV